METFKRLAKQATMAAAFGFSVSFLGSNVIHHIDSPLPAATAEGMPQPNYQTMQFDEWLDIGVSSLFGLAAFAGMAALSRSSRRISEQSSYTQYAETQSTLPPDHLASVVDITTARSYQPPASSTQQG